MGDFEALRLSDVVEGRSYVVLVVCDTCGTCLAETKPTAGGKLRASGGRLVAGSALLTKPCPRGCFSPYWDCNFATELVVLETSEGLSARVEV